MSVTELLPERLPDGRPYEIDQGKVICLSPTNQLHAEMVTRISSYLFNYLPEESFSVLSGDPGFILERTSNGNVSKVRAPDIAVLYRHGPSEEKMVEEPPVLAIEIVSPGDDPDETERRRLELVQFGTQEIWIVYPRARTIHVFVPVDDKSFVVTEQSTFFATVHNLSIVAKKLFPL